MHAHSSIASNSGERILPMIKPQMTCLHSTTRQGLKHCSEFRLFADTVPMVIKIRLFPAKPFLAFTMPKSLDSTSESKYCGTVSPSHKCMLEHLFQIRTASVSCPRSRRTHPERNRVQSPNLFALGEFSKKIKVSPPISILFKIGLRRTNQNILESLTFLIRKTLRIPQIVRQKHVG